nr:hypothetical protein [Tanacetum cinerariifolium]
MMVMIVNNNSSLSMNRNRVTIRTMMESFENPSNEIVISNSNQEKEEPPQDFEIRQLIREECCVEASEEQKQSMDDTMLELVKNFQEKEFLCIHDNVDDLIESALNTKLLLINSNSQRLNNNQQEVKNVVEDTSQISSIHAVVPILSTKEPEHLLSMRYEHLSITTETESDEVTESNAENLLPILSECEVTSEDKRDCDVPVSTIDVCDNHSDTFPDSKIDDHISVYDDDFEDIEYVEASLSDPEIVNVEEENVVQQQEEENDISDDSSNDPLLEEADLFLASDNLIPPGIENVADDTKGDVRFLDELLIDDSILSHEISSSTSVSAFGGFGGGRGIDGLSSKLESDDS